MALEGVEELYKLFQKLFFKVSAAITSCVILFDFYSHERGKDVRLVLVCHRSYIHAANILKLYIQRIQSLEYSGQGDGDGKESGKENDKMIRIRNYRVELHERDHKEGGEDVGVAEEDEIYTEKSTILSGGGGTEGADDHVRLQFSSTLGKFCFRMAFV